VKKVVLLGLLAMDARQHQKNGIWQKLKKLLELMMKLVISF
jgi:hypothetical protein